MKKIVSISLVLVIFLSLVGCGDNAPADGANQGNAVSNIRFEYIEPNGVQQLYLCWDEPTDASDIAGYRLSFSTDGSGWHNDFGIVSTDSEESNQYAVEAIFKSWTEALGSGTYQVRITCVDKDGVELSSPVQSDKTLLVNLSTDVVPLTSVYWDKGANKQLVIKGVFTVGTRYLVIANSKHHASIVAQDSSEIKWYFSEADYVTVRSYESTCDDGNATITISAEQT